MSTSTGTVTPVRDLSNFRLYLRAIRERRGTAWLFGYFRFYLPERWS